MAARKKKTTRRKATRRRASTALRRLERELPSNLRSYSRQVRVQLNRLEKDLEKAGAQGRRRLARLIREASHQLGKLEAHGEPGWRKLAAPYRRDAQRVLKRLENAVKPPARKKARRKKAGRKKTARKKTGRKKKAARRKTTRRKAAGR